MMKFYTYVGAWFGGFMLWMFIVGLVLIGHVAWTDRTLDYWYGSDVNIFISIAVALVANCLMFCINVATEIIRLFF